MGRPNTALIANARKIHEAERSELVQLYRHYRSMSNEWLKRQILDNDRIDILAILLGYELQPFHVAMLQFQMRHTDNLILAFRGAGKSTLCTVTKCIWYLLKDPNLRIVIASKTTSNAETFLREIKMQFETNERLQEVFGHYYNARKCRRWNDREIDVAPRTKHTKEANVTCVGIEGTVVGRHFDVEFTDDLVDEQNARTLYMREQINKWYYSILDPTIEPPSAENPLIGHRHRLGTRYHYDDQYGRWIADELKDRHFIVPALNDKGQSPWPAKWPPQEFAKRKRRGGLIIFNAQYQCDTDAMKGEVFQYDDCIIVADGEMPDLDDLRIFMGVDLAITEKETGDHFAICIIGIDKVGNIYVLDFYDGQLRFGAQLKKIKDFAGKYDPIRIGIEINAFQRASAQALEDDEDEDALNIGQLRKITTDRDKVTRAWKLTPLFEDHRVHFRKSCTPVRDQLVLFPNHRYKDLFDALDLAVQASAKKRRRKREYEPGVI